MNSVERSRDGYFILVNMILQKHKCVPLEDIAAEFKLRTQVVLVFYLLYILKTFIILFS